MPIATLARIMVPVALVAAGGVAFAASGGAADGVHAWIDSPAQGATIAAGTVTVQLHATATAEASIELVVDDRVVDAAVDLEHFDQLTSGHTAWVATPGTHRLVARAHAGSAEADSDPVTVLVVEKAIVTPPRGAAPSVGSSRPTTTMTPTTVVVTTTVPSTSTTVAAATSTTATTVPPPPPRILRLFHAPADPDTATNVTITALGSAAVGSTSPITVRIEARQGDGEWAVVKECPPTVSPCVASRTYGLGVWRYRAVVTDGSAEQAIAGDTDATQFEVTPHIG